MNVQNEDIPADIALLKERFRIEFPIDNMTHRYMIPAQNFYNILKFMERALEIETELNNLRDAAVKYEFANRKLMAKLAIVEAFSAEG